MLRFRSLVQFGTELLPIGTRKNPQILGCERCKQNNRYPRLGKIEFDFTTYVDFDEANVCRMACPCTLGPIPSLIIFRST